MTTGPPEPPEHVAAELRGFGPYGLLAIAVIAVAPSPAFKAILVLAWAAWSGTPWSELGFVWPRSWMGSVSVGVTIGMAFKFLMKAVVMPLLGADPVNATYHAIAGNPVAALSAAVVVVVGARFGEETVFRGYVFERLGVLLGRSVGAKVAMVLLSTLLFALAHYPDQGLAGSEQATVTGLVFGTMFAISGRLSTVMVAHAVFDLTAVAIIYWNLESSVAHLIFR